MGGGQVFGFCSEGNGEPREGFEPRREFYKTAPQMPKNAPKIVGGKVKGA